MKGIVQRSGGGRRDGAGLHHPSFFNALPGTGPV